jgi:GT2 family glycosyltransferase
MDPQVSVVVLTWNNFDDTDECLASLMALDYANYGVVVVDNGSTDGSLERLRERWREKVSFLALDENRGCAGGYNAGITFGLYSGAEFVIVLNNDIVVSPDLITTLLGGFATGPRAGIVGAMIVYYEDRDRVWYAGGRYNRALGYTRHVGLDQPLPEWARGGALRSWETDYVNGCCMMLSRSFLEDVGLFDESLFLYLEDLDLSLRAKAAGYRCLVVGRPLVAHKVSVSSGRRGTTLPLGVAAYYMARNAFPVARRHVRGLRAPVFLFGQTCVRLPRYVLGMVLAGQWPSIRRYLRGFADGLALWKQAGG